MSLADSITDLITDYGIVVTRSLPGSYVEGVWTPGGTTQLLIDIVLEPAFNLNRVIGGANLAARVDNQQTTEVEQFHTLTQLFTLEDADVADVVTYKNRQWTVARVEEWPDQEGGHYYHVVISKQTGGAS